jgi:hypothetical protein
VELIVLIVVLGVAYWVFSEPGEAKQKFDEFTLRVGAIGNPTIAAMSPEERKAFFSGTVEPELQNRTHPPVERNSVLVHPPEVVLRAIHYEDEFAAAVASVKKTYFKWLRDSRGAATGYEIDVGDDTILRFVFVTVDSQDRVTEAAMTAIVGGEGSAMTMHVLAQYRMDGLTCFLRVMQDGEPAQVEVQIEQRLAALATGGTGLNTRATGTITFPTDFSPFDIEELQEFAGELIESSVDDEDLREGLDTLAGVSGHTRNEARTRGAAGLLAAYATLGLPESASEEEVRVAYRNMALLLHPDRHQDSTDAVKQAAHEQMTRVNAAYDLIRKSRT